MLTGNNGVLQKAGDAKTETVIGQEKEQVQLAYSAALTKKLGDEVLEQDLQDELDISVGKNKTEVTANGEDIFNVYFTDTDQVF